MDVDETVARHTAQHHNGQTYHFCAPLGKKEFGARAGEVPRSRVLGAHVSDLVGWRVATVPGPPLSTMRVQARGEMFRIVQWQVLEQEGERIVNWFGIDNVVTVDDKHDRVQTLV